MERGEEFTELSVSRPPLVLALTEAQRSVVDVMSLIFSRPWLRHMPKGDGHTVVLLPGFLGGDGYNGLLRRYLNELGYDSRGWEHGRNLGPRNGLIDRLVGHVELLSNETSRKVTLVSHSLGGIYAREIAKKAPDRVRQVITLGSPFGSGRERGSHLQRLFDQLNPSYDAQKEGADFARPPSVPTTAVYSRCDGIVSWRTTIQQLKYPNTQNIRVRGSHCALTVNPWVWSLLAERLRYNEANWRPFEAALWCGLACPGAMHSSLS